MRGTRWVGVVAVLAAVLGLSGCVVIDGRFEITADEQVSVELLLEVDPSTAARQFGGDVCLPVVRMWPWTAGIVESIERALEEIGAHAGPARPPASRSSTSRDTRA